MGEGEESERGKTHMLKGVVVTSHEHHPTSQLMEQMKLDALKIMRINTIFKDKQNPLVGRSHFFLAQFISSNSGISIHRDI